VAVFRQNRDSGVVWGAGVGVCVGVQPAAVRWYGAGGKMDYGVFIFNGSCAWARRPRAWRLSLCQKSRSMTCFVVGDRFDLLLEKKVTNGEISVRNQTSPDRSPTSHPSCNRQVLGVMSTCVRFKLLQR